jgi:serine protease AprX
MQQITINGVSLDPAAIKPEVVALATGDASKSNYILIQSIAPFTEEQKAQLSGIGVVILEYASENTYLCGYKPQDLTPIRSLPFVAWAGVYHQDFKLSPALRPPLSSVSAAQLATIGGPDLGSLRSHALRKVDIVFHDDVNPSSTALIASIAAAARMNPEDVQISGQKARMKVQERYLADLARIDEVRLIEEVRPIKLFNNVARPILNAHVVVNGTTYEGDGQLVVVNDTGFDKGSTTNVHPAFTGRVAKLVPLGRPGHSDDPDGHGTHVAGSVLGDGNSPAMGGSIQGTAPKAKLIVQSLLDSGGGLNGIPPDLHDLFKPPYDTDKARIQTNSWGSGPGSYSQSSREIDDFIWNHQDCVICFAAGNAGIDSNANGIIDTGSVAAEAAAKNCITVGASESDRPKFELTYGGFKPSSFPANPIFSDRFANNHDGMAAFSSRGPTQEKRIKPDVLAPGTSILSTRSRNLVTVNPVFGTSSDSAFFFDTGTSMATPLVAGCVAVVRETLVKNGMANPSAALIKALLINGAVTLPGQYSPSEAGASPNSSSGWGRVNLAGSIILPGPNPNGGFGQGGPLKQGQDSTVIIKVPARKQAAEADAIPFGLGPTLKVTLVWTDPPGALLQNDLDLIVTTSNGQERHGNMGTSKNFDRVNNVEQVVWENIPPGDVKITIHAFHITQFPQPWAYAWRIN